MNHQHSSQPKPHWLTRLLPTPGNIIFTLLAITLAFWAQSAGALPGASTTTTPQQASTNTIAYQGRLTNPNGHPLSGNYDMTFRLYDASTGGSLLWEEQWSGGVQVEGGLFNVMLGSQTPIAPSLFTDNDSLFLGIVVGGEEMSERVQLGSVPFAMQALTVPDGSITSAKIADGAVGNSEIANNAVGSSEVDANSLTADDLADNAVTSSEIANNAVGSSEVAANSLTADDLADNAVTSSEIAANAVGSSEIAANAVGSSEIADNAVTGSKLDSDAAFTFRDILRYNNSPVDQSSRGFEVGSRLNAVSGEVNGVIGFPGFGVQHGQIAWVPGQGFYLLNSSIASPSGRYELHRRVDLHAGNIHQGAMIESNLQTAEELVSKSIDRFSEGDVLCWGVERLERCSQARDPLVQAVANSNGKPIVIGAEVIKVLGPVRRGDLLVASGVEGYAMVDNTPRSGSVIAQALEDFDGEKGLIKAMIRKF